MAVNRPILVILGPTASGKSALAMAVAKRLGAEILSVDSMQVYRHMDVGTAKPTAVERASVPHHLLDVVECDQTFTVARYVELADAVIAGAGSPVIATGGTPLYYKALFHGMFDGPGEDPELRAALGLLCGDELHSRLLRVDPASATRIHRNDVKRLIRALEVFERTGKPISALQTEWSQSAQRHRAVWIGLSWETAKLNRRINERTREMMRAGWLDEVKALMRRYPSLSRTAGEATGYRLLIDHLHGRLPLDDAIERIKISTRQLARKQLKWFRRWPGMHWLAGDTPIERNADVVLDLWR